MPYVVGVVLGAVVGGLGTVTGLDRERSFYTTVLIVIAFYYVLFAVMGGSTEALLLESLGAVLFTAAALAGFKRDPRILVVFICGHGVFDSVHDLLIANPGVPAWWPAFCGTIDVVIGVYLGVLLKTRSSVAAQ